MTKKPFWSRLLAKLSLVGVLLGIPVLVAPFTSRAQARNEPRLTVVVLGLSYHSRGLDRYNWLNYGIGIEYRLNEKFHVSAGTYHNSLRKRTVYFGGGWETRGSRNFGRGVELGLMTGYDSGFNIGKTKFMPAAVPYLRSGARSDLNVKINTIPPISNKAPAVIAAQLRFPSR